MGARESQPPRSIGRYVLFREIAHGGMATVHIGRLRGPAGFARTVAIKRLHPPFARDPEFVSMFLDEARLAARIQHPNVVSVLDVVAADGELFLVMDYVHGESLSHVLRLAAKGNQPLPRRVLVSILSGVLTGLEAAHEARNENGDALEIVHRDVSPQNVLLGLDGIPRVLDFGVAKASLRVHWSGQAGLKGKLGYMSPEQLTTGIVDRRTDIYAAGVMLWEGLTGRRLFDTKGAGDPGVVLAQMLTGELDPPSKWIPSTPKALDAVALKALSRSRNDRYATAHAMAVDLEKALEPAPSRQVGEWVGKLAGETLAARAAEVQRIERAQLPARSSASDFPRPVREGEHEAVDVDVDAELDADSGALPVPQSSHDAVATEPPPPAKDSPTLPPPPDEAKTGDPMAASARPAGLPTRTRREVWIAAGALAAVLLTVTVWATRPSAVAVPAPLPSTSIAPMPTPPVPSPTPSTATAPPAPSAELPPEAPAPSAVPRATAAPPPKAPAPHATPARPAKPSCDPPYIIQDGVRIPKRECFR